MKNPSHESLVRAGWISDSENPAAMVEVTLVHAGHVSTTRATPLQHDFAAHAVRQRQAKGLFTVCEVAQEFENFSFIADAESFLHNRLIPAITNGKLRVMSESDGFPLADCTKVNVMGDYLTPADVNAWLVKQGTPFRWKEGAPVVEINGLTGAPFCEALQQPEYQKTPEYQAEYNRAVQADIDKTEKQLNEWENLRAETVPEKERKEQKIAALTARINALMASFFPTEPQAAPVVEVPASEPRRVATVTHTTKTPRSDSISPVIELAQSKCRDPKDTNQVWPQMQVLADSEQAPFIASTEKGLKYHKDGGNAYFTRNALDKRLHPEKRKPAADRR